MCGVTELKIRELGERYKSSYRDFHKDICLAHYDNVKIISLPFCERVFFLPSSRQKEKFASHYSSWYFVYWYQLYKKKENVFSSCSFKQLYFYSSCFSFSLLLSCPLFAAYLKSITQQTTREKNLIQFKDWVGLFWRAPLLTRKKSRLIAKDFEELSKF